MADEWSEHTTPEGREYWYNKTTQISSWEKPAGFVSFSSHPDTAGNGETVRCLLSHNLSPGTTATESLPPGNIVV